MAFICFLGIQGMSSNNQQANLAAQMQFGPLLYSYQLMMAQQAQQAQQSSSNKGKGKGEIKISRLDLETNIETFHFREQKFIVQQCGS